MTIFKNYTKSSKDKATKILDSAVAKLEGMETTFSICFPHATLSAASAEFKRLNHEIGTNEPVSKAVSMTMDEISSILQGMFKSFIFIVDGTSGR